MTLTFIALWTLAVVFASLGCWVPTMLVLVLALLAGTRFWFERKARAAVMLREPIRVD